MLPSCYNLYTDFRTVFVFALGPFFPMWVLFFNFNGKMAKTCFSTIKSVRNVLQPSIYMFIVLSRSWKILLWKELQDGHTRARERATKV